MRLVERVVISSNEGHLVVMPDFVRAIFIHCSNKNRNFLL